MVHRNLAASRTEARHAIEEGRVTVSGLPQPKPASLVERESTIEVLMGGTARYVSRGGLKLEAALDVFGLEVAGLRCLDAGASTGGFTDCLLRRGADSVCAVDVGYGQLAWSLQTDDRVTVFDRTNLRHLRPEQVAGPFDLVVGDLSFISLCAVAQVLTSMAAPDGHVVLLVKPQFELGRGEVGKGGIVREAEDHRRALQHVVECLAEAGLGTVAACPSPIRGAKGNREFFVHSRRGPSTVDRLDIEEATQS